MQELTRGWKDDPDTLPWLKQQAQADKDKLVRREAVQELARGWKEHPDLFDCFQTIAINDLFNRGIFLHNNPRQAALSALMNNYPDNPQVLALLQDRAQNDPDVELRK